MTRAPTHNVGAGEIAPVGGEPYDATPGAAEMPCKGGAPIALRADDPTAAPQGGTGTAPAAETPADQHGPTGAPISPLGTDTRVDAHTSVYGPRVTEARGREVATLLRGYGALLEQIAHRDAMGGECVVAGRVAWVSPLVESLDASPIVFSTRSSLGAVVVCVVRRARLVERLDAIGRHDDAAKVLNGPPDAPTPGPDPRARLLVACADDACLAVTWSQSWRAASAEDF